MTPEELLAAVPDQGIESLELARKLGQVVVTEDTTEHFRDVLWTVIGRHELDFDMDMKIIKTARKRIQ